MAQRHWQAFKDAALREGYHESELGTLPGAREAVEKDKQEEWKALTTKTDWSQTSTGKDYFQNDGEYRAAMRDPLYRVNPHYRDAVHKMLAKSDPAIGTPHQPEPATIESMYAEARRDAARSTYKDLALKSIHDPQARMTLLELLANPDPAVQAWIAEGEAAINPQGPLDAASREGGTWRTGPSLDGEANAPEGDDVPKFVPEDEGEKK